MTRAAERARIHRTILVDRNVRDGVRHAHRWQPACSCGWVGVPGRTRFATEQLRNHRRSVDGHTRLVQKGRIPGRQPLTPREDLPEALR